MVLVLLAAVHIYWLFGGRWAWDAAVPTDGNGRKLFRPGGVATPDIPGLSHQPLDALRPRLRPGLARKGKVLRIGLLCIFGNTL